MDILEVCSNIIIRASAPVDAKFLSILQKKKKKIYFFYFTHPFLQNTHISLSILHIYSIKYSKPSLHQPDQYPATINDQYLASIINPPIKIPTTINPINTHQNPLIKTQSPSTRSIPSPPSSTQ